MTSPIIRDIMVTQVITALPEQSVQEGSIIMAKNDVGLLVICESCNGCVCKDCKPTGVVTREDIINKVSQHNKLPSELTLRDIMSPNTQSCSPEEPVEKVVMRMLQFGFKRMPVIEGDKLVGLVSYREILKIAPGSFEILREKFLQDDPMEEPLKFIDRKPTQGNCETCENYSDSLKQLNGKWFCGNCIETSSEL
jgi:CBS domain-containing protein